MTSKPASRSARAMIFAPRSCPSRPGLATTTRILRVEVAASIEACSLGPGAPCERMYQALDRDQAGVAAVRLAAADRIEAAVQRARHRARGDLGDALVEPDHERLAPRRGPVAVREDEPDRPLFGVADDRDGAGRQR